MKTAIFHDHLGSIGGGEKLVIELAKALPADIITTELDPANLERIIPKKDRRFKVINLGPIIQIPILKQIHSSWKMAHAHFPEYDRYIMSGNWSIFACKKHHPNVHYIHTPPRMFYDAKKEFYKIAPWWGKWLFLLWVAVHSWFVEKQLPYVDKAVANSKNTQARIKKYFRMSAKIVYPPIKQYAFRKCGDFWLSVNRFYPHKRLELQIEAFRRMPHQKLVIVGGYMGGDHAKHYYKKITKNLPKNVTLLGEVSEKKLAELYGDCMAFITTAKDEDFGMTVLEAMSAGKPVIATDEGGYKETVIDGKTGYLLRPDVNEITNGILSMCGDTTVWRKECELQAKKFSVSTFVKEMRQLL